MRATPQAGLPGGISQVEAMADPEPKPDRRHPPQSSPPGEFISDDLRTETARFLDELKQRRAGDKGEKGPKLGPPRRSA